MTTRVPILLALVAAYLLTTTQTFAQETEVKKSETEEQPKSFAERLEAAIKADNLGDAAKLIAEEEKASGELKYIERTQLASQYFRSRNFNGGVDQWVAILEDALDKEDGSLSRMIQAVSLLQVYMPRTPRADDFPDLLQRTLAAAEARVDQTKLSPEFSQYLRLRASKASALRGAGQLDEAIQLLKDDLQKVTDLSESAEPAVAGAARATAMRTLLNLLPLNEERVSVFEEHQTLLKSLIDGGEVRAATSYVSAAISECSRIYRSDLERAEALLADAEKMIDAFVDHEDIGTAMKRSRASIESTSRRMESARKIAQMIGQPAPPIDANATWVGVEQPVEMEGKVTLLDFWALWCGPCIQTFPHLKHMTEEYGDKGFQVVGVTRYYNYTWDEDNDRPLRGERGAEPNPEVENEVLKKFLASHYLTHPTMVVSAEATMHSDYGVTGIPHVALLDQKGNVQMVKIGSGEANATAIEDKVRELLGLETESSQKDAGEQ